MKKLTAILFLLLSLAAHAQAPQSTTSVSQPADVKYNNGIGNGYRVTKATGLTVNVDKGSVQCLDQWVDYGGGTKTVTDNAVSYIVLDPAQDCAPVVVSTLSQGTWWLAKITSSGGAVTAITYAHMVPQISKVAISGSGGTGGGTNNVGTVGLTGCGVSWTGLLNFTVSPCTYLIAGTQYSSAQTNLTLTTADATNGRIDVIAVDSTGTAVVITGTPAGSPAEPSVDPATQLRLIAVSVPALATTPSGISETDLYLENTEWTCAASSNFNCASTSNPFAGSDDIEATTAVAGNNVTLTKPSGTVDLSTYANLVLYIRSKAAWPNAKSLSLFWMNGSSVVGASVSVKTGNFGFNSSVTGTYQQVVVPLGSFATGTNVVNKLKIAVAGGAGSIGFYADNISIQSGVTSGSSGPQTFTITPTSPITGGGTAPLGGTLTVACPTCGTGSGNVTGSSLTSGQLIVGNTGVAITTGNLSGDVTTSGSAAVTVAKVNGISYSATAAAHSVEVVTTANTTATAKAIPDCTDSAGNHLNYTQSSDGFSCGTSDSHAGTVTSIATTSPITGGTITSTGTIACATCVTSAASLTSGQLVAGAGSQASAVTNLTGDVTTSGGVVTTLGSNFKIRGIPLTIGTPGGTALTVASTTTDYITVPFACTIAGYNLVIDAGTITVKFWKKATGTAIPTSSDSISTSGVGISSGTAIHSTTTSDFTTTTVTANDIMAMNVTAVSSAAYVQGVLQCNQ